VSNKVYICLPAYNEEESLASLLDRFCLLCQQKEYDYDIILVNDGSKDKTLEIATSYKDKLPLEILNHSVNQGLGEAIRTGFHHAITVAKDDDIIVYMDSDDTHDPVYIPSMVSKINEGFDIVIASRYQKGSRQEGVPFHRQMLSKVAGMVFRLFLPVKNVRDFTCGYRAYRAGLIKRAIEYWDKHLITAKGFACTDEILIKLSPLSSKIAEIPFVLYYGRKKGVSKINFRKTIPATLRLLWTRGKFKRD
jgi:dolichol-phosphate mannosyltransferase